MIKCDNSIQMLCKVLDYSRVRKGINESDPILVRDFDTGETTTLAAMIGASPQNKKLILGTIDESYDVPSTIRGMNEVITHYHHYITEIPDMKVFIDDREWVGYFFDEYTETKTDLILYRRSAV